MKSMKIGELSKRSGIGVETIRFYEREGLLLEPTRRPSGYRLFDEATVERLEYVRRAKDLGFTLGEIKELLELSFVQSHCNHIRQRAESKLIEIDTKIKNLQQMKRSLRKIVDDCHLSKSGEDCLLVHKTSKRTKGS